MGLGSALHLAEAGCTVTVLEREESVAKARKQVHQKQRRTRKLNFSSQRQMASNVNGAMLCPSLCASWASFKFLSKVRSPSPMAKHLVHLMELDKKTFRGLPSHARSNSSKETQQTQRLKQLQPLSQSTDTNARKRALHCNEVQGHLRFTTALNLPITPQNRNELRRIKLSASALTDPAFYRWCAWFAVNGLWPGRDERNHEAQRSLGAYSIDCLARLKVGRRVGTRQLARSLAHECIYADARAVTEFTD